MPIVGRFLYNKREILKQFDSINIYKICKSIFIGSSTPVACGLSLAQFMVEQIKLDPSGEKLWLEYAKNFEDMATIHLEEGIDNYHLLAFRCLLPTPIQIVF